MATLTTQKDFVNRTQELDALRTLARGEGDSRIALLVAAEGMGKTWLLRELGVSCNAEGILTIRIDLALIDGERAYRPITEGIQNILGPEHAPQMHEWRERILQREANPQQATVVVDDRGGSGGATTFTFEGAIYGGQFAKEIYNINITEDQWWKLRALTFAFQSDLSKYTRTHRMLIIVDNWQEHVEGQLWLRASLLTWISSNLLNGNVSVVIAGREVGDLDESFVRVDLPEMPDEAIKEFWVKKKQLSAKSLPRYLPLLRKKPLHMDIIARAVKSHAKLDRDEIFGRVITTALDDAKYIDPQMAQYLRLAAVPRTINAHLLNALDATLPMDDVVDAMQERGLLNRDRTERLDYHADVRQSLLEWWRGVEHERNFRDLNRRALNYYESLEILSDDKERVQYMADFLYHQLLVDETEALGHLIALFESACSRYEFPEAETLLKPASELKGSLGDLTRDWITYFEMRLALEYRNDPSAKAVLERLHSVKRDDTPGLDDVLRAAVKWTLGEVASRDRRWKDAVRIFQNGAKELRGVQQTHFYDARLLMALGNAYRDLADLSGGFPAGWEDHADGVSRWLHHLQHLPLTCYRWLVRRTSWLPNWYFGTNYQVWIIAYFLTEARSHYQLAANQLKSAELSEQFNVIRIHLAEIDYRLGMWSRARQRYSKLDSDPNIQKSYYRQAQISLGLGRVLLAQGNPSEAINKATEAAEIFRGREDWRSLASACAVLARANASPTINDAATAVEHYTECIVASGRASDGTRQSQIAWELGQFWERKMPSKLRSQELQRKVEDAINRINQWHYVARFPHRLLHRFRHRALVVSLPLAYFVALILSPVLTIITLAIVQSGLVGPTLGDTLLLIGSAIGLPLLALWSYTTIYSVIGFFVVRRVARELIEIEKEQPDTIHLDTGGFVSKSQDKEKEFPWPDVRALVTVDYNLVPGHPIRLISQTLLASDTASYAILGITAGYEHLKGKVESCLGREIVLHRDFSVLRGLVLTGVLTLGFRLLLLAIPITITVTNCTTGVVTTLPLATFVVPYMFLYWLTLPGVFFWQLITHRRTLQRVPSWLQLEQPVSAAPLWVLGIVWTLLVLLVVMFLTSATVTDTPLCSF